MGQQDHGRDPSPAEIRAACIEIQRGWSVDEERQRRTGSTTIRRYEVPAIAAPKDTHGHLAE